MVFALFLTDKFGNCTIATSSFCVASVVFGSIVDLVVDWLEFETKVWLDSGFTFKLLIAFGILVVGALVDTVVIDQCYQLFFSLKSY